MSRMTAIVLVVVLAVGCTAPSMNVRRSGIRGAGDLAVTATLDGLAPETAETARPKIVEAAKIIEELAAQADGFTLGGFAMKLKDEIPLEAAFLVDALIENVGDAKYHELLGEDEAKYVVALARGARRAAEAYNVNDRKEED